MYKFIRIIDEEEYEEYLRCRRYKYIPKKLLYIFQNWIKPRVICNYISRLEEEYIGCGVGIFLKRDVISQEEYKDKLIDTINKLKTKEEYKDLEYLIKENLRLDYDELIEIEHECNIKVPKGKFIFEENTLSCLKEICKLRNQEISQKEVFIVSDDTKVTEDLINKLSVATKFIAVFTEDDEFGQKLEKDMFEKYGLSLHVTKQANKIYNNFDFIINLNEKPLLDISRVSRNKIIIDLSENKILNKNLSKTKRSIVIDDLFLKNDKGVYSENEEGEFEDSLNTSTSSLINRESDIIEKIQIFGKVYSIDRGIEILNLKRQDNSYFNKV